MENGKNSFIRPEFLKPQLSTKLYRSTFNYLRRFYSETIFDDICTELKMPKEHLLSDDNWVSVEFGRQFAQKLRQRTEDPDIYKKIGQSFLSPETINLVEFTVIKNLSPFFLLKSVQKYYQRSNRVGHPRVVRASFNEVNLEVTCDEPIYGDMVQNTLGVAESFRDLFDLENFSATASVNDPNKIESFSISIKFSAVRYYLNVLKRYASVILGGLFLGWCLSHFQDWTGLSPIPGLAILICISATITWRLSDTLRVFRRSNEDYHERMNQKNLNIYQKTELLERRYQEASLVKQLSHELIACHDSRAVIDRTLAACSEKFNYKKAAVFLLSKERKVLFLSSSVGFEYMQSQFQKIEFKYPNPDAQDGFIAAVLQLGKTVLIQDVEAFKARLQKPSQMLLTQMGVGSLLMSPIQSGDSKYGVLAVVRGASEEKLAAEDSFLVENLTAQLSLYFESAGAYENEAQLRHVFQKYVPQPVLEQLLDTGYSSKGVLQPKRAEICSLFVDLRGFTSTSEELAPERVFDLVNIFSSFVSERLAAAGAIVDNIIGDAIVSFFVAPHEGSSAHIEAALHACSLLAKDKEVIQQEFARRGFPRARFGIGIHSGMASLGSVGSDQKMNYTALGRTVNVASRLQTLCKKFDQEEIVVVVSQEALSKVYPDQIPYELQRETLRGVAETVGFCHIPESRLIEHKSKKLDDAA